MSKPLELVLGTGRAGVDVNNRTYGWWKEVKDYFWEDTKGAVILTTLRKYVKRSAV